jgi:antitoxin ParD1/3/4
MTDKQDRMTTMNVSLPESLRRYAEERARTRYSSASEYIRELIRRDQKEAAKDRLEELLIEGLESGDPIVVTEDYWLKKRQELAGRHAKKKQT